ncbi:MAG: hypothetical protein ACJ76V_07075 [Thermoleophilaceae bacterium]
MQRRAERDRIAAAAVVAPGIGLLMVVLLLFDGSQSQEAYGPG